MTIIKKDYISFEWNDAKNESNKLKHGVSFETALTIFFDEKHLVQKDFVQSGEQRWKALGRVENSMLILFVGHIYTADTGEEVIRIITARRATTHEEKEYYGNH